jgi:hypothetical protein
LGKNIKEIDPRCRKNHLINVKMKNYNYKKYQKTLGFCTVHMYCLFLWFFRFYAYKTKTKPNQSVFLNYNRFFYGSVFSVIFFSVFWFSCNVFFYLIFTWFMNKIVFFLILDLIDFLYVCWFFIIWIFYVNGDICNNCHLFYLFLHNFDNIIHVYAYMRRGNT